MLLPSNRMICGVFHHNLTLNNVLPPQLLLDFDLEDFISLWRLDLHSFQGMGSWIPITLSEVLFLLSSVWFRCQSPMHSLRLRDFNTQIHVMFSLARCTPCRAPGEEKKIPHRFPLARCTLFRAPNEEKQLNLATTHSSNHLLIKQKITGLYT
jgi:hypothetical protein